jgi:predicted O-methyltransferase YrrM
MKWKTDLIKDPRFNNHIDDIDHPIRELGLIPSNGGHPEFTNENHAALQKAIDSCKQKPKTFMEIGVCRNGNYSSTHTIIKNVPSDGIYLGVDLDDKSFLNNPSKGIHTLKTSSSNYSEVIDKLNSLGVDKLDFLFIDGWHSINQVLADWEYTNILSSGGVVAFHDTKAHPGPHYFMKYLNLNKWEVYPNLCPWDHGFGYCFMKEQS